MSEAKRSGEARAKGHPALGVGLFPALWSASPRPSATFGSYWKKKRSVVTWISCFLLPLPKVDQSWERSTRPSAAPPKDQGSRSEATDKFREKPHGRKKAFSMMNLTDHSLRSSISSCLLCGPGLAAQHKKLEIEEMFDERERAEGKKTCSSPSSPSPLRRFSSCPEAVEKGRKVGEEQGFYRHSAALRFEHVQTFQNPTGGRGETSDGWIPAGQSARARRTITPIEQRAKPAKGALFDQRCAWV